MVSSWASNGQKGEKLSLFAHLCPRVTFNVPLYNMTQLWCEWSHWFDFWFACRPLAPAFSDAWKFGTAVNRLVAKWRITGKKAQNFEIVWYQLWAALGELFIEMWNFFLVHFPCVQPIQQDQWWQWSVLELRTGRKVRNCRFLPNCAHLSLSTYLSITTTSCDVSGRIELIFGLLVGRCHPHSVTTKIWHCCE